MKKRERGQKYKDYQKWYYETHTKRKRAEGTSEVKSYYKKKTPEEKAKNYAVAAEKRMATIRERYGDKLFEENGKRLVQWQQENPDKKVCIDSERAKELAVKSHESRRANKKARRKK